MHGRHCSSWILRSYPDKEFPRWGMVGRRRWELLFDLPVSASSVEAAAAVAVMAAETAAASHPAVVFHSSPRTRVCKRVVVPLLAIIPFKSGTRVTQASRLRNDAGQLCATESGRRNGENDGGPRVQVGFRRVVSLVRKSDAGRRRGTWNRERGKGGEGEG